MIALALLMMVLMPVMPLAFRGIGTWNDRGGGPIFPGRYPDPRPTHPPTAADFFGCR